MSAGTTVTILCENTAGPGMGVLGEHGFSALVERDGLRLLFDTGGGYTIANNAARLRQDLGRLDGIILSHGHWDHTGGLFQVLALQEAGVPVYIHPATLVERYSAHKNEAGVEEHGYAGAPWPRTGLEATGVRFDEGREPREIAGGVWLSGEIPRRTSFERVAKDLHLRQDGRWVQDEVPDEQSLFLRGGRGLIAIMGCAHPGMINIVEHGLRVTGIAEVQAVVGGTHLVGAEAPQLEATLAALHRLKPQLVGTAHCTGIKANARIAAEFGDAFRECSAGAVLQLE